MQEIAQSRQTDHVEYEIVPLPLEKESEYATFRISLVEYYKELVVPIYEKERVTKVTRWEPDDPFQLVFEAAFSPLTIPLSVLSGEPFFFCIDKDTSVERTGTRIRGGEEAKGPIKGRERPCATKRVRVALNEKLVSGSFRTDEQGVLRIAKQDLANAYMLAGKVAVCIYSAGSREELGTHRLDKTYGESLLDSF